MKTTLLTLALAAAGVAVVTVAQAQPAPSAPAAPAAPTVPAPTATTDPNAPPPPAPGAPAPGAPAAAPTATTTAPPAAPPATPPGAPVLQDPNAPPAPPPVAPPPPVAAQPVPAPAPFVPPPAPPAQFQPPAPAPAAPAPKPPMSLLQRFAGSSFSWNHSATTTIFGVGRSNQGDEGDAYTQSVTIAPAIFLYRSPKHNVRALTSLSIFTELTNSDSTTQRYQTDTFDMPIRVADTIPLAAWGTAGDAGGSTSAGALARDPTLAGAAEYRTWLLVNGGVNLPTSRASQGGGLFLTSSLAVGLRQQVKLFGSSSDYLGNITFTLSETWQHQFSRATTPTNGDLNRPRQTAGGDPFLSDQLGGGAIVENRLIHNFSFFLPVYGDLQLSTLFQVWNQFPHKFKGTDCEVQLATGCVDTPESDAKMRSITQFDISLYYQISPELGADVGYNNFAGQLGEDGQFRNPFYSPGSLFYADIILFPDQLIKRITTPAKPPAKVGRR